MKDRKESKGAVLTDSTLGSDSSGSDKRGEFKIYPTNKSRGQEKGGPFLLPALTPDPSRSSGSS